MYYTTVNTVIVHHSLGSRSSKEETKRRRGREREKQNHTKKLQALLYRQVRVWYQRGPTEVDCLFFLACAL